MKAASPVTFQQLSFSNQGTPLISVSQIPTFNPQGPTALPPTKAPEPLKLFEPTTFQFGSRQTQQAREPTREPVRQQQPIREQSARPQSTRQQPVRQQQPARQQPAPVRESLQPIPIEKERPRSQQVPSILIKHTAFCEDVSETLGEWVVLPKKRK